MVLFGDIKQDDGQRITDQQNAEGLNDFHFDIQTQINHLTCEIQRNETETTTRLRPRFVVSDRSVTR